MKANNRVYEIMIITLLAILSRYIGISMPIVGIVYPILLTLTGIRNSFKYSVIPFVLSAIFLIAITGTTETISLSLQYGILSMVTVYMIKRKYKKSKIIIIGSTVTLLMFIIQMTLQRYIQGVDIISELDKALSIMIDQNIKDLKTQNLSNREISIFSNFLKNTANYIVALMPSLLIISSVIISYINYYIPMRILKKSGIKNISVPYFSKLILPKNAVTGLGTILILTYLLKYIPQFNSTQLMSNVMLLILTVFTLEGLSITTFVLNKLKVRSVFKYFILIAIIFTGFLNIALFSIGIIDVILDFRRLRKKSNA